MPVWERQEAQEAGALLGHGDKMHMGIDPVKAQLHAPALVGLQQGLQRQVHMLPQQDGMVCPGGARIHAGQLLQVPGGLELAHPAPLHCSVSGVIHRIAISEGKRGPDHSGKHRLIHIGIPDALQALT